MDYEAIIYLATVGFLFLLLVLAASRMTPDWRQWAARFALTAVVFVGLVEFYQLHRALMYPKGMPSIIQIVGVTGIAFAAVAVVEWALRILMGRSKNE